MSDNNLKESKMNSKKVWDGRIEKDGFASLQEASAGIMGLKKEASRHSIGTAENFFKFFQNWSIDEDVYEWLTSIQTSAIEKTGLSHDIESAYEGGDAEMDNSAYIQSDPFAPSWGIKDVAFVVRTNKNGKKSATYFNPVIKVLKSNADPDSLNTAIKIAEGYAFKLDEYLSKNPMDVDGYYSESTTEKRRSIRKEANMTKNFGVTIVTGIVFEHTGKGTKEKLDSLMGAIPIIKSFEILFIQDEDDDGIVNATISVDFEVDRLEEISELSGVFNKADIEFVENL